jgi:hypothetical protein
MCQPPNAQAVGADGVDLEIAVAESREFDEILFGDHAFALQSGTFLRWQKSGHFNLALT